MKLFTDSEAVRAARLLSSHGYMKIKVSGSSQTITLREELGVGTVFKWNPSRHGHRERYVFHARASQLAPVWVQIYPWVSREKAALIRHELASAVERHGYERPTFVTSGEKRPGARRRDLAIEIATTDVLIDQPVVPLLWEHLSNAGGSDWRDVLGQAVHQHSAGQPHMVPMNE